MASSPEESQGIGTPSEAQPGFAPHAGAPLGGPAPASDPGQQPPAGWRPPPPSTSWPPPHATAGPLPGAPHPAPQHWAAPDPRLVVPPPPTGRRPRHEKRARYRLVAISLAAALVLVAVLGTLPLIAPATESPQSAPTPAPLVTDTPSVRPANASTATTGGDLGRPVAFQSAAGSGTVTVNSAVWTDAGDMAAPAGRRYLVVEVTIACNQGTVGVDALMFLAVAGSDKVLPGFGPTLATPLGGQVVKAGRTARGQVGYVLPPGAVSLNVLDANLHTVAEIGIPAP